MLFGNYALNATNHLAASLPKYAFLLINGFFFIGLIYDGSISIR